MVYDQSSRVAIVFGGFGNGSHLGDTWALNTQDWSWKNMQPENAPRPRAATTLVYDPVTNHSILFGGFGLGHSIVSNETWSYHYPSNRWTEIQTTLAPSERASYGMALDSKRHEILLFGGFTEKGYFNDLWAYDIDQNAWRMKNVTGSQPEARGAMSFVYDTQSDVFVMFGGFSNLGFFSDTWIFDPNINAWTELEPNTRPPPVRTRMVYDQSSGMSVFFGGDVIPSEGHQGSPVPYDKSWAFDSSAREWSEMTTSGSPGARALNGMAYDSDSESILIFGGTDSLIDDSNFVGREYRDTWKLAQAEADGPDESAVMLAVLAIAAGGGAFAVARKMRAGPKPK
jgi:N-acetylneuraminic acid mutarotase